ncbi:MAG: c-type cytochrome [Acidobacteriia bacterium]|nr:c-type cytochrome [Terriglobia bacterium]
MFKTLVVGMLLGMALLAGGGYYYFVSGMAPAAAGDPMMPFEHMLATRSLRAHIEKANIPPPPIAANDETLIAGAKLYKENCAVCHGLPDHTPPVIADNMFPHAPLLFKGKGVSDDPPQESYWKIVNGIRLTGMPAFKSQLNDTQMWQVALLVAGSDKLSDAVKKELMPEPPPDASTAPMAAPAKASAARR